MELPLYLIKVNVAILLLYGLYRLLFRSDTFFRWKRFVLVAMPVIALLYPFLMLPDSMATQDAAAGEGAFPVYYLNEIIVISGSTSLSAPILDGEKILRVATFAYLAVTLLFLIRIILQTVTILSLVQKANPTELCGRRIYVGKGLPVPFSFLDRIVLDPEKYSERELKEILLHEETHVRQGHSFDLILSKIICSLCWPNPFVWLLKEEIRINLEYLADRAVLESGCEAKHYQFHLLRLSHSHSKVHSHSHFHAMAIAKLTNNFNVSPLKKRIIMMNRKKTSPVSIWKYALLAPVFAFLAFFNKSLKAEIQLLAPAAADAAIAVAPADKNARDTLVVETATLKSKTIRFTPPKAHLQVAAADKNSSKDKKNTPPPPPPPTKVRIYSQVDEMPAFPGGGDNALMTYLVESLKYPIAAVRDSVQGRVIVSFIVSDSGKIEGAKILQSLHPDCDAEAIRVVEAMPVWTPGKEKGIPVNVSYTVPIVFRMK
ncbi:MAG: M56 family metallopeptidase [Prevotellaceae bacterium]|jgi:TonB family protein|nr:M56 family metallopeptidase [Prevotellaceae bacterium]